MTEQVKTCGEQLKASLDKDQQRWYDATAKELERKQLDGGDVKGASAVAQKWYRKRSKASKPTYHDEESTRKEYEGLHKAVEPMGEEIPIHINPKPMVLNDKPPEEEEAKEAVRKLNIGKAARRATRITAEHIKKEWMKGTEERRKTQDT
jgi:hypothetical protein